MIEKLPISLLELNTLGHAICTLLIYCLWWKKPLDIGQAEAIPVSGSDLERLVAAMCVTSQVEVAPQDADLLSQGRVKFYVRHTPHEGRVVDPRRIGGMKPWPKIPESLLSLV